MTSATPAPAACGAFVTTHHVDTNTSARLYSILKSQATKRLVCCMRNLRSRAVR